ncbi:unnamed protein product [Mytilus coruscus]|uniref:CCHC-type domain-containing protein n=1 Tax=Mytilus coruscus TaxID=42192 RepID=A0A6J8CFT7_MYTCO|nr:unnamed protein product [Mytilus coruscus]
MNRYDSDDNLALFHDTYMPRNYESEDAEFNELLSLIPTINTPNNSVPLANQPGIFIRDSDAIMEKLAACRKFGGYPHENASVFMKEFTSFATLHKIDHADDQRMIAAFHLNLTGPALTWFNSLDAGSKRTWRQFLAIFDEKYIELDWQSPTVFLESENFQNMKLNRGQILEDFYGQIVEKAQILKKKDHEILSQFIKGLPEQLAFFVRAGTHKDSASALSAAKMGEAYGYRKDDVVCVAAAKPLVANDNNPVQELQNQVKELTKALSELKSHSTDIKPGMPPKYQKPRYNNPRYNNNFSSQAGNNRPKTCFNCQAPGHYRANCNWNGHGEISLTLQCQLCQQFGHGAFQCHHHSNPGNQSNPGGHRARSLGRSSIGARNRSPPQSRQREEINYAHYCTDTEDCEFTDENLTSFKSQFIHMPVKVNHISVAALVDSGSSINIISKSFYDSLPDTCKTSICSVSEKIVLE